MKTKSHPFAFISLSKKLAIFMLAFLFVFQPILVAFADDTVTTEESGSTTDTTQGTTGDTTGTTETTTDTTTDTTNTDTQDTTDLTTTDDTSMQSLTAGQDVPPPSGSLLPLDAKTRLAPEVDNLTGALVYNYPLTIPEGRNGMTPKLSLRYNSQNTQNDSEVGYGWSLSIPYITRLNKHGSNDLYNSSYNDFATSDQGELSQVSTGVFGLHSDDGSLSTYTLASNVWTVTTKDGMTYSYGATASSRQDDAADTTHVYKWMLDKVTDSNGNSIAYTYYKDQGQIYPDTITYTNTASTTGIFSIVFARDVVPAPLKNYIPGFSVVTKYRINSVTASVSGTQRRNYTFAYVAGDNTSHSLISSITDTGYDVSGTGTYINPTAFTYQKVEKTFSGTSRTMPTHTVSGGHQDSRLGKNGDYSGTFPERGGTLSDVNGDGLIDWIESSASDGLSGTPPTGEYYAVWLGTSTGWVRNSTWSNAMPYRNGDVRPYFLSTGGSLKNSALIDVNGDGLPDWVNTTARSQGDISVDPSDSNWADYQNVWINNGAGWTKSTTWTMPTWTLGSNTYGVSIGYNHFSTPTPYDYSTTTIDVNNDGLLDLVQTTQDSLGTTPSSVGYYAVYLNNGSGWVKNTTWTNALPLHVSGGIYTGARNPSKLVDINNDKLPDWVETLYNASSTETYVVWLNNGNGWTRNTSWVMPVHTTASTNTSVTLGVPLDDTPITCAYGGGSTYICGYRDAAIVDVNNDGLADIIETINNSAANTSGEYDGVWLNTGKGWVRDATWTMPPLQYGQTDPFLLGDRSTLSDVNNDGFPDWVINGTTAATSPLFMNSGKGWDTTQWIVPQHSSDTYSPSLVVGKQDYVQPTSINIFRNNELHDINNDGLPDWIESTNFDDPPSTSQYPFEHYKTWVNVGGTSDLLSTITFPLGGSSTFGYTQQPVVDKNGSGSSLPVMALTSMSTNDNMGHTNATSYSYSGGKFLYNTIGNTMSQKFAGFHTVTTTYADGSKQIAYFLQGDSTDTGAYEFGDHESKAGKLYRLDQTDAAGNLYTRTTTKWTRVALASTNSDRFFVYPSQTITETFDGNGTEKATAEIYTYDTTLGNLLTDTTLGQVTATTPLAYTDTGTDSYTATYQYATGTSGITKPSIETVTDQSSNKVRETRHFYDTLALGSITLGNETKLRRLKSGTVYVNATKTYNSYGLVATSSDELGNATTYTYDTYNLYPATVTDALSHSTQYVYDYAAGKPTQTIDQNNFTYQTDYDGFGQVVAERQPDQNTPTTLVQKVAYSYVYGAAPSFIKKTQYLDGAISVDSYQYLDGLGRLLQERDEAIPDYPRYWFNYYNVRDYQYTPRGQVLKESLPHSEWMYSYGDTTSDATLYTNYTYDPLNRLLTSIDALGTTSYAYDDWKTTVTDPNNKVKKYYKEAYGNLAQVDEINGASTYTTTYAWDGNQKLTQLVDALGNVRNFTYDNLARRLTAEDLHGTSDTTFGSWSYVYDDADNLTQSTSPNGSVTNYTYDTLNRQLTEDDTGTTGADIGYTYDSCTNGIGKLCTGGVVSTVSTAYTYSPTGAIASESKTIAGQSNPFTTSYTYDRQSNILTVTYPDLAQVQYVYNPFGQLDAINRKESGGAFTSVVSRIIYSPLFQVSQITYANGVATTNTYDATKRYRLTRKLTQNTSGSKLQDLNYTYDPVGNISTLTDASNTNTAKNVAYSYDDLSRLTQAVATSTANSQNYTETETYDALGDILTKNSQAYLYKGNTSNVYYKYANPHAVTSVNGVIQAYDTDGNFLGDGAGALVNTWNYKDQLMKSVTPTATINYYYDHNGDRVKYKVGTTSTYYPNKYYSLVGTNKTKEIFAGDMHVATIDTTGSTVTPRYVHEDNEGSTNVISTAAGVSDQTLDYFSFGALRQNIKAGSFDHKRKYATHALDDDTAMDYVQARYYKGDVGRFISQDFIAKNYNPDTDAGKALLTDPQLSNMYSYARNNPIILRDIDGKQVVPLLLALGEIATPVVIRYAPQITSFLQSLTTPLGQYAINQAGQDAQKGNWGMALVGGLTAGDIPEGKGVLRLNEELGGHAIEKHVGKTVEQLAERFNQNKTIQSSTSYFAEDVGDFATNGVIKGNANNIEKWLNRAEENAKKAFTTDLSKAVGHGIDRSGNYFDSLNTARVIIQKDGSLQQGYKIISSFPLLK